MILGSVNGLFVLPEDLRVDERHSHAQGIICCSPFSIKSYSVSLTRRRPKRFSDSKHGRALLNLAIPDFLAQHSEVGDPWLNLVLSCVADATYEFEFTVKL